YIDLYAQIATDTEFATLVTRLRDANYTAESEVEKEQQYNFAILLMSIWLCCQVAYDKGQIDQATFQIYLDDVEAKLTQWPAIKPYTKQVVESYLTLKDMEIFKPVLR
ncbi:MAG: hypothetical protein DRR06_19015, partial [Gammaproteobacteria bacterium]